MKQRSLTTDTCDAVSHLGAHSSRDLEHNRTQTVVSPTSVGTIGEQGIVLIVKPVVKARPSVSDDGQGRVGIVKADESILLEVTIVVGQVTAHSLFGWRLRREAT